MAVFGCRSSFVMQLSDLAGSKRNRESSWKKNTGKKKDIDNMFPPNE